MLTTCPYCDVSGPKVSLAKHLETDHSDIVHTDALTHGCPKCGTRITCDWAGISQLEEAARRLKIVAGIWRAKQMGRAVGRPKLQHFDVDAARALVREGLSLRATAGALGVHHQAIARALTNGDRG